MPRPAEDAESRRVRARTRLRGVAFGAAVVLGAVAVWLIVTGATQKRIEIGVLAGLWGLLLAAYSIFGTRRTAPEPEAFFAEGEDGRPESGQEMDLRYFGPVMTREAAAARRAYEYRLEEMLRRQMQAAMAAEVASLRAEIAALRSDLVEKVGGQLRLERIETTRLIGSDIVEALQQEVRQLAVSRQLADVEQTHFPSAGFTETAFSRPVTVERQPAPEPETVREPVREPEPVREAAAPVREAAAPAAPEVAPAPAPAAVTPPPEPVARPRVVPEPVRQPWAMPQAQPQVPTTSFAPPPPQPPPPVHARPEPEPEPEPQVRPAAQAPAEHSDPFASLPRLTPFSDVDLVAPSSPPQNGYAGRRRTADEAAPAADSDEPVPLGSAGRHSTGEAPASRGGGRRRREDDGENDVLTRILQREASGS